MRFIYPNYNMVICISHYIKKQLLSIPNLKTQVIYNPSFFKKFKIKKNKNKYLINLTVGRLEKSKDQITILKAINLIKNKIPLKLTIVGYGSQKIYLQNFIEYNSLKKIVQLLIRINLIVFIKNLIYLFYPQNMKVLEMF